MVNSYILVSLFTLSICSMRQLATVKIIYTDIDKDNRGIYCECPTLSFIKYTKLALIHRTHTFYCNNMYIADQSLNKIHGNNYLYSVGKL